MSSIYTPDRWELLKVESAQHGTIYKILASWYGGFVGSNSWKISSGIERVIEHDDHFELPQSSGSTYICYKGARGTSGLSYDVFTSMSSKLATSGSGSMTLLSGVSLTELHLENSHGSV